MEIKSLKRGFSLGSDYSLNLNYLKKSKNMSIASIDELTKQGWRLMDGGRMFKKTGRRIA